MPPTEKYNPDPNEAIPSWKNQMKYGSGPPKTSQRPHKSCVEIEIRKNKNFFERVTIFKNPSLFFWYLAFLTIYRFHFTNFIFLKQEQEKGAFKSRVFNM